MVDTVGLPSRSALDAVDALDGAVEGAAEGRVLEAGAEDFGALETAVAAGEALTPAADEVAETDFVPAGVATETVLDFAGAAVDFAGAAA